LGAANNRIQVTKEGRSSKEARQTSSSEEAALESTMRIVFAQ